MFDEITRRDAGRRAARRARYLLGATAAQAAALLAAALVCSGSRPHVGEAPAVPVKIVRSAPPAGPPHGPAPQGDRAERPAPAPAPARAHSEHTAPRPQRSRPVLGPRRRAPPQPEPSAPGDEAVPAPALARGERSGSDGEGPGGDGGPTAGPAGALSPGSGPGGEEAPAYPAAGWRPPQQAERGCVQNSVRIPGGLRGFVHAPITVRFAVGADGAPSSFQLVGEEADARIRAAIWQAIQSCKWIAGSDAQGRPARLWVIMPIRFEAG